jgi:isoleucyl-tRNA synthetase
MDEVEIIFYLLKIFCLLNLLFIKNIKKSVTEAFIRLFERDLIYRDLRPINWCCSLKSALSDAEVNQNKFTKNIKLNSSFLFQR